MWPCDLSPGRCLLLRAGSRRVLGGLWCQSIRHWSDAQQVIRSRVGAGGAEGGWGGTWITSPWELPASCWRCCCVCAALQPCTSRWAEFPFWLTLSFWISVFVPTSLGWELWDLGASLLCLSRSETGASLWRRSSSSSSSSPSAMRPAPTWARPAWPPSAPTRSCRSSSGQCARAGPRASSCPDWVSLLHQRCTRRFHTLSFFFS